MNEIQTKREKFNLLVEIINKLDITQTQYNKAKERYEAVGKWLAEGKYCFNDNRKKCFEDGTIYPQGSFRLETVIKPVGQKEFDVDLVFFIPNIKEKDFHPEKIKEIIGDRLRSHEKYKNMLEELKRGWRINYKDEFHLDITPAIPHNIKGEWVPDSKLQNWKASNPREYAIWFNKIAEQLPNFLKITKDSITFAFEHSIEDFPENDNNKPVLKRFIQIMKRHRDLMFKNDDNKPISIIITTLATHSYNECIKDHNYDNELELFYDVIKNMPKYIKIDNSKEYKILNPTHKEENFAEKWNEDSTKKIAFDTWHKRLLQDIKLLKEIYGIDKIFSNLEEVFGNDFVKQIEENYMNHIHDSRKQEVLSTSFGIYSVKKNTFYGK